MQQTISIRIITAIVEMILSYLSEGMSTVSIYIIVGCDGIVLLWLLNTPNFIKCKYVHTLIEPTHAAMFIGSSIGNITFFPGHYERGRKCNSQGNIYSLLHNGLGMRLLQKVTLSSTVA